MKYISGWIISSNTVSDLIKSSSFNGFKGVHNPHPKKNGNGACKTEYTPVGNKLRDKVASEVQGPFAPLFGRDLWTKATCLITVPMRFSISSKPFLYSLSENKEALIKWIILFSFVKVWQTNVYLPTGKLVKR